jgi:hypothetical protein
VPRFPRLRGAEIGYDPAFATDIAMKLQGEGFRMVEILQNYKYLSEPAHLLEALVKGKRVRHDGHRVLRWNVENCTVKQDDAGRIRPVKPKRATRRIDGVVATLMGVSRLMVESIDPEPSIVPRLRRAVRRMPRLTNDRRRSSSASPVGSRQADRRTSCASPSTRCHFHIKPQRRIPGDAPSAPPLTLFFFGIDRRPSSDPSTFR